MTNFQVFGNNDLIKNKSPVAVTVGNFDGVHIGHRFLLDNLKKNAKNLPIVVVSFYPHPVSFFNPNNPKPMLTNLSDRIKLLLEYGADTVIIQSFDSEFASLSADDFCSHWLRIHLNIKIITIGYDFCYGKGRMGNFHHLSHFANQFSWKALEAPVFAINSTIISSSLIRKKLSEGKLEEVASILGREYSLSGLVVKGNQIGRTLGYPTANLCCTEHYVIPKIGIYTCLVELDDNGILLPASLSCGMRPSIAEGLRLQIEAYILNFSEDIYGHKIRFHLKHYIRSEIKFHNLETLKEKIAEDVIFTKKYFNLPL